MHFATLFAATCATLASALPFAQNDGDVDLTPGYFNVTDFTYGCSATCGWSLTISMGGAYDHHPSSLGNTVSISGGTTDNTDYVMMDMPSPVADTDVTTQVGAFIVKDTNELKLKYVANFPSETAVYSFYGSTNVFAETSPEGAMQAKEFLVQEDLVEAIA